jgi:hypothetical protein
MENLMKTQLSSFFVAALSAAALALVMLALPEPAQAWQTGRAEGPYCLESNGRIGIGRICDFYSLAQCQATARGIIGTCAANPWYVYDAPPERVRRRRY